MNDERRRAAYERRERRGDIAPKRDADAFRARGIREHGREQHELRRVGRGNETPIGSAHEFRIVLRGEESVARGRCRQTREQRFEFEIAVEHVELVRRGRHVARGIPRNRDRQVARDDRDVAATPCDLAVFAHEALEFRRARKRRVLEQRVERTRGLDELDRRLLADAGNAGKIVGRIALEPAIVRQLSRIEIEARTHGRDVVPHHATHARAHRDRRLLIDDLQEIVVARDDDRFVTRALRFGGERCDHVVRFFAFDFHRRNVVDLEDVPHERELRT